MTGQLVQYGQRRQRRSFARIKEVLELPNLIEIQTASYEWFLEEGLREMFRDISPIEDFTGNLSLEFIDYSLGDPKYHVDECKERDVTYACPVEHVEARSIHVRRIETIDGKEVKGDLTKYKLQKFIRSNQGTSYNQRPLVKVGERVKPRDILADGPSMEKGELALGRNVLVAFMTWNGFNYEDAVIMSEPLVKDDVYTSVHIEEYESEFRDTKLRT
ncbi:DNA-directed RNA polymerase subunit beta [Lysinibacillus sphaericus]